jgi:hypothetical protein
VRPKRTKPPGTVTLRRLALPLVRRVRKGHVYWSYGLTNGGTGLEPMEEACPDNNDCHRDQLAATWIELIIRLGVLGLLLHWSFVLVLIHLYRDLERRRRSLYPAYEWMVAAWAGGAFRGGRHHP